MVEQNVSIEAMEAKFFHIDVNSAFLSWSAIKLLEEGAEVDIRTVPSIVGGDQEKRHGIVTAKSIPAKKYGIETAEPVAQAMKKCPGLVVVPPDFTFYRKKSGEMMDYLREVCPALEQASIDECYLDYASIAKNYKSPMDAAITFKETIKNRYGFTVNVGISDVKVLAKMASDFTKPDRIHTLYSDEIKEKMWPLPVGDLYMCGKAAAARLRSMGIMTIGDLAQSDPDFIRSLLKSQGSMLWGFANGRDNSVVHPVREKVKGVGNSTTLPKDIADAGAAKRVLKELCQSVSGRLKKGQFKAGSICVEIKYADFKSYSHQKPIYLATAEMADLYREACLLFDEFWNGEPIRLLGVRTTKLIDVDQPQQLDIFSFMEQKEKNDKREAADAAMETLKARFGDVIKKGD